MKNMRLNHSFSHFSLNWLSQTSSKLMVVWCYWFCGKYVLIDGEIWTKGKKSNESEQFECHATLKKQHTPKKMKWDSNTFQIGWKHVVKDKYHDKQIVVNWRIRECGIVDKKKQNRMNQAICIHTNTYFVVKSKENVRGWTYPARKQQTKNYSAA